MSGGRSMRPSGLSPIVPAATLFAATAQATELTSKSSVRGFMITVEKFGACVRRTRGTRTAARLCAGS
jgi:hypothetical protein